MDKHNACMHILKTLEFSECHPTKHNKALVTLHNGKMIEGITTAPGLVHLSIYTIDGVVSPTIKSVRSITQVSEITYSALPISIECKSKHDSLAWVKANLKALLWEVNHTSYELLDAAMVISIKLNHHTFDLTTSGTWGTLPMWFRHRFLGKLWDKLSVMVDLYGADPAYCQIQMCSYNNLHKIIGLRTPYIHMVDDGIVEVFKTTREDHTP